MKKIEQFQITSMTVSGFKSYEEPVELVFGNPTVITGGNGRGKTSIADAIAFAVTGLPFFGERGIDKLHNEVNPDVLIRMRFVDGAGVQHELTRCRKNNRMTITYDGYEIRQLDLTDLFGERDVFLSIFNPLYFIEELGESGKNLLERYLPSVSHEEVLARLDETIRDKLKNESILSPEVHLKGKREEIRQFEERITYLMGQKDLAERQGQNQNQAVQDLVRQMQGLQKEIENLEQRQFSGLDLPAMQERLVELSARYGERTKDGQAEAEEYQKSIQVLQEKIARRQAEVYQSKYTQAMAETEARIKERGAQYSRETKIYQSFVPGCACPVCRRAVTEESLPEVQAELAKSIKTILEAGKEQRSQLDELRALDQKSAETFEQFKAEDLKKWGAEVVFLGEEYQKLQDSGSSDAADLRQEIQTLTADLEFGNLTQAGYERLKECREELNACKSKLEAFETVGDMKLPDFEREISEAKERIVQIKSLISDVIAYISKRAELTFSHLRMNKVEISLYDVVKSTGEARDTFKFNYGGRRYDRLSLSEKVRAGMEVSELMKRLTGRNYPVFLDNMESIDDLANVRPTGQIIMAKCVANSELQVKPLGPVPAAAKIAA